MEIVLPKEERIALVEESFSKRGSYIKVLMDEQTALIKGMLKIKKYMMDCGAGDAPTTVFHIPPSQALKSLFVFAVGKCRYDNDHTYDGHVFDCYNCFHRNDCFKKILRQVEVRASKTRLKRTTVDEVILGEVYVHWVGGEKEVVNMVRAVIISIGRM